MAGKNIHPPRLVKGGDKLLASLAAYTPDTNKESQVRFKKSLRRPVPRPPVPGSSINFKGSSRRRWS